MSESISRKKYERLVNGPPFLQNSPTSIYVLQEDLGDTNKSPDKFCAFWNFSSLNMD